MRKRQIHQILKSAGAVAGLVIAPAVVRAQGLEARTQLSSRAHPAASTDSTESDGETSEYSFKSRSDSLSWVRHRAIAAQASGFHLVVSLQDRHIWAIVGEDTVLSAPAAVASGTTLEFGNKKWTFDMPRGVRTVLGKEADPIWQPPEWLYAETAEEHGLKLGHIRAGHPVHLSDGRELVVRNDEVGVMDHGEWLGALPTDEHIVFDNTLFIPPLGTKNRKVEGELGKYRLILGDGFLLHGTPYKESIGLAATHGCVRLRDEDIEWLYEHVPVGTKVYIY
jgi:hypothetical protein